MTLIELAHSVVHFPDTEENEEYEAWVADMRDTVGAEYDD